MLSRLPHCIVFTAVFNLPLSGCSGSNDWSGNAEPQSHLGPTYNENRREEIPAGPPRQAIGDDDIAYDFDIALAQAPNTGARPAVFTLGAHRIDLASYDPLSYLVSGDAVGHLTKPISF
jgi:hypothetical protein